MGATDDLQDECPRYKLLGADGRYFCSETPGVLGGYKRSKIYGRLDCSSARRAIDNGDYVKHRVFFADEATAVALGYRPCAVCIPLAYQAWKAREVFEPEYEEATQDGGMNVVCICSWSSICFGIRGILYQWTSQRPVDRNLLLCGVYVSGALIAFTMNLFVGNHWTNGVWFGVLMGLFSFIANGSMYKGFAVGKASVIALFTGLPPLVVVTSAYLLWRESLNPLQLIGFSIVLIGILTIRYANDLKQGQFVGWQWGILTMLFFGFTDVSSKQATIAAAETLPVLTVMYGTGSLCFAFLMMRCRYSRKKMMSDNGAERSAQRSEVASANQQAQKGWTSRRTFLWGMVVGISNIVGMIFVVPAFRDGVTGIVSAISAMNVLIVLLYVQFYLKENLSKREISGIAVTLAGILLIRLAT